MTSMRIIIAYANHHDYEIMSFNVKTAFLHAKLSYLLYVKQSLASWRLILLQFYTFW